MTTVSAAFIIISSSVWTRGRRPRSLTSQWKSQKVQIFLQCFIVLIGKWHWFHLLIPLESWLYSLSSVKLFFTDPAPNFQLLFWRFPPARLSSITNRTSKTIYFLPHFPSCPQPPQSGVLPPAFLLVMAPFPSLPDSNLVWLSTLSHLTHPSIPSPTSSFPVCFFFSCPLISQI